ncbi:hypothetical protein EJF18_70234 [Clavispora lusitaniae]|uniref:Uncharacterized protein n=1 Tax=Clavispora lusitaniae TaxID=36911 RepID=A0ACD0WSA6_CLALS|nr:hypothetical protein EJF14_70234 [Clavispora lusitaniae]QFZ35824.1 hypothetical protein EJF16_70234 [Clavispora lusitaniae]QFZ41506.1 hypothetical protein EJF15_70234 [Clavispora lusitaniae]QFZ47184.1 hypothetical protein EJF18_70234 [Clavispora lusitaniae]QFZ52861.1 hypothetical protein EJF17_70234 [Clavispora lusitaniae]
MARWESDEKNAKFRRECKSRRQSRQKMQNTSWSFRREEEKTKDSGEQKGKNTKFRRCIPLR